MWPHRRQPTRLPGPWDSPGKNTGVGCHFLLQGMKVKSESEVAQSCPTLRDPIETPSTAAHQAPPSMGFSRQEYWSGVPLPSPGLPLFLSNLNCSSILLLTNDALFLSRQTAVIEASSMVELPCSYTGSPWIDTKSSVPCLSSLSEFLNSLIYKTAFSPWKSTGGADCFVLNGLRKVWAKTWLRTAGRY